MEFIKLFFVGFLFAGKNRFFYFSICALLAVFISIYEFNKIHFISILYFWVIGIGTFMFFLKSPFTVALTIMNVIAVTTWCLTNFDDRLLYNFQNISIGLVFFWLIETYVNYRDIQRRRKRK